jgi:hypothetical protein
VLSTVATEAIRQKGGSAVDATVATTLEQIGKFSDRRDPTVFEISELLVLVIPSPNLEEEAVEHFRDACLDAIDRGAASIVVDLTSAESVSHRALEVLDSLSMQLRARGGTLSLAHGGSNGYPFAIVRLGSRGSGEATGLNAALDEALAGDR